MKNSFGKLAAATAVAIAAALPALVVVRLPSGITHFVVAWRRHGGRVQVMDPGSGRRSGQPLRGPRKQGHRRELQAGQPLYGVGHQRWRRPHDPGLLVQTRSLPISVVGRYSHPTDLLFNTLRIEFASLIFTFFSSFHLLP